MASKGSALRIDDLVRDADPEKYPEGTFVLTGWLGKAARAGRVRLYATPELDDYVEFAEADIVLTRPLSESVAPLGGTVVVIKSTTELSGATRESVQARIAFLQGDIMDKTVASCPADMADGAPGIIYNKNYTKGFWCSVSMLFACATHVVRNRVCTLASGKLCGTARFLP